MFSDTPSIPTFLGTITTFLFLDVLAVPLRFVTRRRLRQQFQADDWLTIPSLLGVIGLSSIIFFRLDKSATSYRWQTIDHEGRIFYTSQYLELITSLIFFITSGLVKLSVLTFYRRIFVIDTHWKNVRNLYISSLIVITVVWTIAYTFAFAFMCGTHLRVLWNPTTVDDYDKYCVDTLALGYSVTISAFISDAVILLIPIPFIIKLHLPLRQKIAIFGVFMLGSLASGASLVRLAWMTWRRKVGFIDEADTELQITTGLYWMTLEVLLGLLASCLPSLSGLFKTEGVNSMLRSVRSLFTTSAGSSQFASGEFDQDKSTFEVVDSSVDIYNDYRRSGGNC